MEQKQNPEQKNPRENLVAGIVGAFLGSLIGVVCIVLLNQLGYVAAISGVVMAVCALKGYALLGGRLSKRGAVISGLLILVMTYIANKLCFAFAVAEAFSDTPGVNLFTAYQSIGALLETGEISRMYWGELALLYLFTLLGGVPVIVGAFREPVPIPAAREAGAAPAEGEAQTELRGELYALRRVWMRPLLFSVFLPILAIVLLVSAGWLAALLLLSDSAALPMVAAGLIYTVLLYCFMIPTFQLCSSFDTVYARVNGKLWRVNLNLFCQTSNWEKLTPDRQATVREEIFRAIQMLQEGREPLHGANALLPLEDIRLERETKWGWKISYETASGRRKKLNIGKGYPGFSPVPEADPPQGPVPCRWSPALLALLPALVLIGCGLAAALKMEPALSGSLRMPQPKGSTRTETVSARVPESAVEYEMSEIWFRVDGEFQYSRRTFLDGDTGTSYRVFTQYGVDENDAWDTLTQFISKYRTSPLYDRFDAVYLEQDPLAQLTNTTRYNIVSVYLTNGEVYHTAAVLSDSGALFGVEAVHNTAGQSVDEVLANLMYMLKTARFEGPTVTEDNYQSQIHISEVRDCGYMAAAYLKTSLFGHDAFVDVYVPYSDSPLYSDGGRAIQTEAHGLRVYATILPGTNAQDVVEAQQQALAASGRVYAEGVSDELYREDLDAACKLTAYEEDGQTRYAVLYADSKWEGYYLFREITGLPELVDEAYPAVLAELEEITGLTMPALERLGQQ